MTPGRLAALAVIAVVASLLVYLRVSGESRLGVPDLAVAGDLTLKACRYETEDGKLDADCGTLVVPEHRADPESRLIAIPIVRIHARSAQPSEPIFRLEGGPGITNMTWPQASRFVADHDFVLVGYRGVDGSERLDCPEVTAAIRRSTDLVSEAALEAQTEGIRACGERLTRDGIDIQAYGLVQQVDDLEAARVALGYGRINLLSESAGTRTALIYAWRYPDSIRRSVMVGVNPPGHFLWDPQTFDEQVGRYAELCATAGACSQRTTDLLASVQSATTDVPGRWLGLPIEAGNARLFSFFAFMESTTKEGPLAAPVAVDAWLAAEDGDASGVWLQSVFPRFLPLPFVWGQYYAAGSLDFGATRDYFARWQPSDNLGSTGTAFAWAGGRAVDAWPAAYETDAYRQPRRSDVEMLLIGGALDTSTPPQTARDELMPFLPNARQVVLPGFGHTLSVWTEQPEAGTHLITTFFESGRVDDSLYQPQRVDFTPPVTLTAVAKWFTGAMAGLVLLAAGSLALMACRVWWCGHLGRWSGIAVRSAYGPVLGLGGWSVGALAVLATASTTPLDGGPVAALAIGAPVGLGMFLGWVHRERAAAVQFGGLGLATVAAFAGAWLGFGAVEGAMGVLMAVAGASIAANAALIACDVALESWQPAARVPATAASEQAVGGGVPLPHSR